MPIQETVGADLPVTTKCDDYTLLVGDGCHEIQFCKATAVTANLLTVAEAGNGYNVIIRNIGAGTLTIDPAGTETIDGQTTVALAQDDWRWIRSDGTMWKSVAEQPSTGGAGAWVPLAQVTASSSTSVDFTSGIDSTYDVYAFTVTNNVPTADGTDLQLLVSLDGGTTWKGGTGHKYHVTDLLSSAATYAAQNSSGASTMILAQAPGGAANEECSGIVYMFGPANTTYTKFASHFTYFNVDGNYVCAVGSGVYDGATGAVDGIRFQNSLNGVASGVFRMYGIKNS